MERIDTSKFDKKIKALIDDINEKRQYGDPGLARRYEQLLKFAEEKKDAAALGMAYYYMAEHDYDRNGRAGKFEDYLSQAITYQQEVDDHVMLTHSYSFLGRDVMFHGHPELAYDYYRTAREHAGLAKNRLDLEALSAYNIGLVYTQMGEYEEALTSFRDAASKINSDGEESPYYHMLRVMSLVKEGTVLVELGDTEKARELMKTLRDIERGMSEDLQFEYFQTPQFWIFEMMLVHKEGDMAQCNILIPQFIRSIRKKPVNMNSIGDVLSVLFSMLDGGFIDFVEETMEVMKPRIDATNILYFKLVYARVAVYFYRKKEDAEAELRATKEHFDISEKHREESEKAYSYFIKLQAELDRAREENEKLEKKAITDELTQISNRFHLNDVSEKMFKDAWKQQVTFGFEILDVDNFKRYNDGFGHQVGDLCLKTLANRLAETAAEDPEHMFVARYGGDEFVAVYMGLSDEEILEKAKLVRERVTTSQIETGDETEPLTTISISQGIMNAIPPNGAKLWDYMFTADHALYSIKQKTKGEICLMNQVADTTEE